MTIPGWQRKGFNVAEMRKLARRRLPRPIFDFGDGGAENEETLRRSEEAFGSLKLLPKPLEGAGERDLSVTLFGRELDLPFFVGPTGLSGLFWPEGELCVARASRAAGTGFCLSHASTSTMEDVAAVAGERPRWMQVFLYRNRDLTRDFVERAQAANYDALVLTVDNQILGQRERDLRNGFSIPPHFKPLQMAAMATKVEWLCRMGPRLPSLGMANYRPEITGESDLGAMAKYLNAQLDQSLCWKDVDWVRGLWKGPLILKGVLHPEEAVTAIGHGVDGVIVSTHGGRQLDGAISSIEALPAVVKAVEGRIPVLLDGGIRRGVDILRALALGAGACLLGRPQLWGLAVAGEAGVAHILSIYRKEFDRAMGLCGLPDIAAIGPELLAGRPFGAN